MKKKIIRIYFPWTPFEYCFCSKVDTQNDSFLVDILALPWYLEYNLKGLQADK